MFCYFSTGVLILIYIFALRYFRSKAAIVLNVFQIVFFIFILYSSTLSSRASSVSKELFVRQNVLDYGFTRILPQTFFSEGVYDIYYFTVSLLMSASILFILYLLISKNYYYLLDTVSALNLNKSFSKPKISFAIFNKFVENYVLHNNYERASFNLVKNQLYNSKFLRVKYVPIIFMPLLLVIIGIVSDAPNLLFFNKNTAATSFFKTALLIISPSITFTLIMCSRLLISNTKISDDTSANTEWIYDSLPVSERRFIFKGVYKYIYCLYILPVAILITVLLSFKADLFTVLLNMLFILSGMYFISSVAMLFDKTYPFTLESTKFNSASKFMEVLFAIFLGIILFLIQIFVFQNIIFVIIAIIIFIIVALILNRN